MKPPQNNAAYFNPFFTEERQPEVVQSQGPRSIPMLMDILSKINFREFVGRHLKTAQVHQACMGLITPEEIRYINQYLAQKNKENGVAEVQHGSDMIDMDDLIDAI